MSTPNGAPTPARWEKVSRLYRRPPGLAWLIGLALIPLLLTVIGYSILDRSRTQASEESPAGAPTWIEPTAIESTPVEPAPPAVAPRGLALAPLAIVRHGDEITLEGELPDETAKRTLLDSVITSVPENSTVVDNLGINPDVRALDFSRAGPVFDAAAAIPDFRLTVTGDTVTLAGTAAIADDEDAVAQAAEQAWMNVNIVNKMLVSGPVTSPPAG